MLLKDKKIFLLEDQAGNLAVMMTLLQGEGAIIKHDRWGRETVSKLQNFAPVDIILLDLMISETVSGYDVFDAIRTQPEFAHVPIVAVSASEPSVAIPETRKRGFSGFIAKPINIDHFPRQLAQVLEGETLWDNGTIITRKR
jgi:CheY-like chemotaxis protein